MKLTHTINRSLGFKACVYFNPEYSEFVVKFYDGKEHRKDADYFTDDKQDAIQTANAELARMCEMV